jgi:hypothetical protein
VEYGAGAVASGSAGGGGGEEERFGEEIGATWGMAAGATLPSSAETSGGGVVFGVVRGPRTRVLSTKGPSTTSSTERISQAVTWWPLTYSPPTEPESCTAAFPFWK